MTGKRIVALVLSFLMCFGMLVPVYAEELPEIQVTPAQITVNVPASGSVTESFDLIMPETTVNGTQYPGIQCNAVSFTITSDTEGVQPLSRKTAVFHSAVLDNDGWLDLDPVSGNLNTTNGVPGTLDTDPTTTLKKITVSFSVLSTAKPGTANITITKLTLGNEQGYVNEEYVIPVTIVDPSKQLAEMFTLAPASYKFPVADGVTVGSVKNAATPAGDVDPENYKLNTENYYTLSDDAYVAVPADKIHVGSYYAQIVGVEGVSGESYAPFTVAQGDNPLAVEPSASIAKFADSTLDIGKYVTKSYGTLTYEIGKDAEDLGFSIQDGKLTGSKESVSSGDKPAFEVTVTDSGAVTVDGVEYKDYDVGVEHIKIYIVDGVEAKIPYNEITEEDGEDGNYVTNYNGQAFALSDTIENIEVDDAEAPLELDGPADVSYRISYWAPDKKVGTDEPERLDNKDAIVNAGTYEITALATGKVTDEETEEEVIYAAQRILTVVIKQAVVINATITLDDSEDMVYNGSAWTPEATVGFSVQGGNLPAEEGHDYAVTYLSNINAGQAVAKITLLAGGNFTKEEETKLNEGTFEIAKATATAPEAIEGLVYNSQEQKLITAGLAVNDEPVVYALLEEDEEAADVDWTSAIPTATDAGEYTVAWKVADDYAANYGEPSSGEINATINPASLAGATVTLDKYSEVISENGNTLPKVTKVVLGGKNLTEDKDYEVSIEGDPEDPVKVNDTTPFTVKVTGINNYTDVATAVFQLSNHAHRWSYTLNEKEDTIVAICSVDGCDYGSEEDALTLALSAEDAEYDGKNHFATVENSIPVAYTVEYTRDGVKTDTCIDAGEYTASVKLGSATAQVTFNITPKELSAENVEVRPDETQLYHGYPIEAPSVIVTDGSVVLTYGKDYTFTWGENTDFTADGEYTVTVKGIGNYTDNDATGTFTVNKADAFAIEWDDDLEEATITVKVPDAGLEEDPESGDKIEAGYNVYVFVQPEADYALIEGSLRADINTSDGTVGSVTVKVDKNGDYYFVMPKLEEGQKVVISAEFALVIAVDVTEKLGSDTQMEEIDSDKATAGSGAANETILNNIKGQVDQFISDMAGAEKAPAVTFDDEDDMNDHLDNADVQATEDDLDNLKAVLGEDDVTAEDLKIVKQVVFGFTYTSFGTSNQETEDESGIYAINKIGIDINASIVSLLTKSNNQEELDNTNSVPVGQGNRPASFAGTKIDLRIPVPGTFKNADHNNVWLRHESGRIMPGTVDEGIATIPGYKFGFSSFELLTDDPSAATYNEDVFGSVQESLDAAAEDGKDGAEIALANGTKAEIALTLKAGQYGLVPGYSFSVDAANNEPQDPVYNVTVDDPNYVVISSTEGTVTTFVLMQKTDNVKITVKAGNTVLDGVAVKLTSKKTGDIELYYGEDGYYHAALLAVGKYDVVSNHGKSGYNTELKNYEVNAKKISDGEFTITFTTKTTKNNDDEPVVTGGGGGGGGGSSSKVNVASATNGTVTVSNRNAGTGETVTVTAKPNAGYKVGAVTVTDAKGNTVAVTDNGNGTYTFKMPNAENLLPVRVNATFVADDGSDSSTPSTGFTDVADSAWYADAVKWAVAQSITQGKGNNLFAPNDTCTRAEAVTFLYRAAGSPAVEYAGSFSDVASGDWFANAVAWAVANGITQGKGEGMFDPYANCSRAEIVTFLARFAKAGETEPSTQFDDVAPTDYFAGAVAWAVENGITQGKDSANTFAPNDDCSRAEIVTFLYRNFVK